MAESFRIAELCRIAEYCRTTGFVWSQSRPQRLCLRGAWGIQAAAFSRPSGEQPIHSTAQPLSGATQRRTGTREKREKESLVVGYVRLAGGVPQDGQCCLRFLKYHKKRPKSLNATDGDGDGPPPTRKAVGPAVAKTASRCLRIPPRAAGRAKTMRAPAQRRREAS